MGLFDGKKKPDPSPDPAPDPDPTPGGSPDPPGTDPLQAAADETAERSPEPNAAAIEKALQEAERLKAEAAKKDPNRPGKPGPKPGWKKDGAKGSIVANKKTDDKKKADPLEEKKKDPEFRKKCRRAGEATIDGLVLSLMTVLGPGWWYKDPFTVPGSDPPLVVDERRQLREIYGDVFEEYGWTATPSWIGLTIATGGYIVARLKEDKPTQDRILSWKESIAAWWAKRKVRKDHEKAHPGEAPPPPAPPPGDLKPAGSGSADGGGPGVAD